jgi:ABC-type multidrug transport system permease subunit
VLVETPLISFLPMIYAVIVYFKIGLTITASQFFYLILLLLTHTAASMGYFLSSIFNNTETASAVSPIVIMPIMLFGE